MENAAKALMIAGGVLLAVIILVAVVFVFDAMGQPQKEQETALEAEQLAAFNQEFEVYNKPLMYGVDVLSVLNKVYSNNKKQEGIDNREVEVVFTIKNEPLIPEIEVYYQKETRGNKAILQYMKSDQLPDNGLASKKIVELVKDSNKITDEIWNNYGNITVKDSIDNNFVSEISEGTYSSKNNKEMIQALIQAGVNYEAFSSDPDTEGWYKIVVKTPASDFKSRKFRCDGIEYHQTGGRVSKITFSER